MTRTAAASYEELSAIGSRLDACAVECDGFARLVAYELTRRQIEHETRVGRVAWLGGELPLHFWTIAGGLVLDYRLRLWFGSGAPHGVFPASVYHGLLAYAGERVELNVSRFVFELLGGGLNGS